jgi:carboxypeptidase Taq
VHPKYTSYRNTIHLLDPLTQVTYPLHIILRYELESALVAGTIDVDQLPALWRQKMKEYLGTEPETDAQGVLQDVHWSAGLFGYFPTYTLGAMCACQIFRAAERELGAEKLAGQLAAGEFAPLRAWLREKVHEVGSLHPSADELLTAVTGSPLEPDAFLAYLNGKYRELYGIS